MKHKQKTKSELLAMAYMRSLNKPLDAEDMLSMLKRNAEDRNMQVAFRLAIGCILYQLWQHDNWTPEELQSVVEINDEFRNSIERGSSEDLRAVSEMMADLQAYCGYDVTTGRIVEDGKEEEN